MLRWIVALLLAANLAWLAWAQGWLRPVGLGPQRQGEPERVAGQWKPEALRVSRAGNPAAETPHAPHATQAADTANAAAVADAANATPETPAPPAEPTQPAPATMASDEAATASNLPDSHAPETAPPTPTPTAAAPATPTVCLQAGLFNEAQATALRQAAAALPAGTWQISNVPLPSRWMVYAGKFASAEAAATRRHELHAKGIDTDRPGTALEPGLSLGRFSSEEAAQRATADLARRGISGLRVVREKRDATAYTLRIPAADANLKAQWATPALRRALAGKALRPCE